MNIKPGDILLTGGDSFIQKKIRFFTGSDFSHSCIVMPDYADKLSVLGTTSTIVNRAPLEHEIINSEWILVVEPNCNDDVKIGAAAVTYLRYSGMLYSYQSYIWFIYRYICKKLFMYEPLSMWKFLRRGVTCSELVAYYIGLLGIKYRNEIIRRDLNAWSPAEIHELVLRRTDLFTVKGWLKKK